MTSTPKEVIDPFCSTLVKPQSENWVQKEKLDFVQRLVLRIEKGLDLASERMGRMLEIREIYV